jgi:hypothetical protein
LVRTHDVIDISDLAKTSIDDEKYTGGITDVGNFKEG